VKSDGEDAASKINHFVELDYKNNL
jgi:hypothetical protein